MPKSQQYLLGLTLILFVFNIIIPVVGAMFNVDALDFSSMLIKCTKGLFILVFVIFTYRQIKRKGFK
ncbi:hypothetical protein [Staphylococcus saprophyticus]|uniref:hypothetical protein n=1 Tax=Staphylococcus saprophyticus TaxID=29385 RepID=UPI000254B1DA|nr:hypothetical protein [Staphylococcus saprophyticus]EHY91407.1 hypothetical protein SSME_24040 [Staphylococcus saprophyticus subsp. saprophyticus KACC 16562]MDW4248782.1 hypothetical protein [Staphylococcus saprophyticus]MDW4342480.1 hypothetical protein [Staphylococcus saprophyticus]MDW4372091.1 hypothetical protein [Staphylococcus saprophyticus]MDW4394228.1 hypothetical protein [Staphylococcus saprophyticus]